MFAVLTSNVFGVFYYSDMATPKRFRSMTYVEDIAPTSLFREASGVLMPLKEILPDRCYEWLETISFAYNTRPEFVFTSAMVVTSALVGPKLKVSVSQTYQEPLNLFLVNVAYPGSGKSQAFRMTSTIDALPISRRDIFLDDYTRRGLTAHLSQQNIALMAYEEMSGFFEGMFKRQNEGSGERAFICRLYDGGTQKSTTADNIGRSKVTICENPHVAILGFQTPATFVENYALMLNSHDGLCDRFLIASPASKLLKHNEVEEHVQKLHSYAPHMRDFKCLYGMIDAAAWQDQPTQLSFNDEAKRAYIDYADELVERMNEQFNTSDFSMDGNLSKDKRTLTR